MSIANFFPSITSVGGGGCCACSYFKPEVSGNNGEYHVLINPGVIYRSFNLKDMMIWSGYIDEQTRGVIEKNEGTISGHIINGLNEYKRIEKNGIVYLKINVSPSLYATNASIEVGEIENPWSGYPEPIIYNPPLEFDDDGVPKVDIKFRRQKSAIVPIAYLTDDLNQDGESLTFSQGGEGSQRTLVRSLCGNLMMFSFNYEGTPIAYPLVSPIEPFFYYITGST